MLEHGNAVFVVADHVDADTAARHIGNHVGDAEAGREVEAEDLGVAHRVVSRVRNAPLAPWQWPISVTRVAEQPLQMFEVVAGQQQVVLQVGRHLQRHGTAGLRRGSS